MKKLLSGLLVTVLILGAISLATIKEVKTGSDGIQITFRDNTGYWIEY